jgi:copper chaperone
MVQLLKSHHPLLIGIPQVENGFTKKIRIMETLRFKTNLKCSGCVGKIAPGLDTMESIGKWSVDLESPDKILEMEATEDISDEVIEGIKKAGYQISQL